MLHFVSDAGMFARALRSGGLAAMVGDASAFRDAFLISRELLPVVRARGVDLRRHRATTLPWRFPRLVAALTAAATGVLPIARASLEAHTDPVAAEPRAVLEDALHSADRSGVAVPRLRRAVEGMP